jgi:hypothetical protein
MPLIRCPHCGGLHCEESLTVPHKCPVCDGTGLVSKPPYIAGDVNVWSDSSTGPWPCKTCGGAGVIWAK